MSDIKYSAADISKLLGMDYQPTDEQTKVIEAPLGSPVLVIAGAGAGKTEVMSSKIVYMVTNGLVKPNEILALTFANKATQELDQRIKARLNKIRRNMGQRISYFEEEYNTPKTSTYNAFALMIVQDYGYKIGISPLTRLITDGEVWQIFYRIVQDWQEDLHEEVSQSDMPEYAYRLYQEISEHGLSIQTVKEKMTSFAKELEDNAKSRNKFKISSKITEITDSLRVRVSILPVIQAYVDYKKQNNLMDFADQLRLAIEIVDRCPEIVQEYKNRYKVVLLDEYQDTSSSQINLLSKIFNGHDVIAVGDPKQAIYGWRGASIGAIENFDEKFSSSSAKTRFLTLSVSWRNSKNILDYANTVCQDLYDLAEDYSFDMPKLQPHEKTTDGQIVVTQGTDLQESFEIIARYIYENKLPDEKVAIICRRKSIFTKIQEELSKLGIKSQKVGLDGLLMQNVIQDLLAFLRVSVDNTANKYLLRIFDMMNFGVRDMFLYNEWTKHISFELTGDRRTLNITDCLEILPQTGWYPQKLAPNNTVSVSEDSSKNSNGLSDKNEDKNVDQSTRGISAEAVRRLEYISKCVNKIRRNLNLSLEEQVKQAIRITGLDIQAEVDINNDEENLSLRTFCELARKFDAERTEGAGFVHNGSDTLLASFLGWLDATEKMRENLSSTISPATADTVQILTIHAAKGLEWDTVIVPELIEGKFPSVKGGTRYVKVSDSFINPYEKFVLASGWLTDKGNLPYELRDDAQYLPAFDMNAYKEEPTSTKYIDEYRKEIGQHLLNEELRLAYVVFTRAKKTLVLSAHNFATNVVDKRKIVSRYVYTALNDYEGEVFISPEYYKDVQVNQENIYYRSPIVLWPKLDYNRIKDEIFETHYINVLADVDWEKYQFPNNYELLKQYKDLSLEEFETEFLLKGIDKVDSDSFDSKYYQNGLYANKYVFNEEVFNELKLLLMELNKDSFALNITKPTRLATTSLIKRVEDEEMYLKNLRRPLPKLPSEAARLGTIFHDWVQSRQWDNEALFTLDEAGEGPSLSSQEKTKLSKWKTNFLNLSLVSECEFVEQEEEYEYPVLYMDSSGKSLIENYICRIDAVLRDKDGQYIVVDWKTGKVPQSESRKSLALQLGIYRLVWASNNNIDLSQVKACFAYVDSSEVIYLDDIFEGEFDLEYLKRILVQGI